MTGRKRGYRERLAKRGGLYCVDVGVSKCEGPIEADHEVRLADNGPEDWTSGRCRKHHQEKTAAEAKAAKKGQSHRLRDGWQGVLAGVTLAVAAAGSLVMPWAMWVPLVIIGGLLVFASVNRMVARAEIMERLVPPLAKHTHTPAKHIRVRVTGWDGTVPESGVCWYGPLCDDDEGSADRKATERMLERKIGIPLAFGWDPAGNVLTWRPRDDSNPPACAIPGPPSPLPAALKQTWKGEWLVDETDDRVVVTYPPTMKVWQPEARVELTDLVATIKGGRWRLDVDAPRSTATVSRRPVMPKRAIDPNLPGEFLGIGISEDGDHIPWDLGSGEFPHALVTGTTGSGKTVLLRRWARTAHAKGWDVRCVDPKRFELAPLRREGIRVVSSTDEMCRMVAVTYDEMERRNAEREAAIDAGEPEPDFPRILFILDEVTEFIERANEAHREVSKTGEHPANAKLRSLARLARAAKITVVLGIQRPDAKILGGEARSNYRLRIALGPLEPEAARMMFGSGRSDVGRDTPMAGRASVAVGDRIIEVQTYWDLAA